MDTTGPDAAARDAAGQSPPGPPAPAVTLQAGEGGTGTPWRDIGSPAEATFAAILREAGSPLAADAAGVLRAARPHASCFLVALREESSWGPRPAAPFNPLGPPRVGPPRPASAPSPPGPRRSRSGDAG
jgi:hypothetical protein